MRHNPCTRDLIDDAEERVTSLAVNGRRTSATVRDGLSGKIHNIKTEASSTQEDRYSGMVFRSGCRPACKKRHPWKTEALVRVQLRKHTSRSFKAGLVNSALGLTNYYIAASTASTATRCKEGELDAEYPQIKTFNCFAALDSRHIGGLFERKNIWIA